MTRRDDFSVALRYAAPPPVAPDQELDALGVVRLIRRRFWQIVGIAALIVALAFPLILGLKPTYYADSRLLIQNPLTTALASSAEDRMVQLNLTTEVERMLSRDVSVRVIRKLGIDALPEFNGSLRAKSWLDGARALVRGIFDSGAAEPAEPPDDMDLVIPAYMAALGVSREPMSDVVRIGFASEDPALAAAVPNALLEVYLADREASLARNVRRADDWLEARVADQTARVAAATAAFEDFGEASGLSFGDPLASATQTVATLAAVRTDIERKRFELSANLADIEAAGSPSDKAILAGTAAVEALERDLRQRRNELDRLLQTYGDSHTSVAAARSAVSAGETELEIEIARHVQAARAKLAALDQQDAAIAAQMADAAGTISRLEAARSHRTELRRIADAEQAALERLQEQGRALAAEGELPVADVDVLSPATPAGGADRAQPPVLPAGGLGRGGARRPDGRHRAGVLRPLGAQLPAAADPARAHRGGDGAGGLAARRGQPRRAGRQGPRRPVRRGDAHAGPGAEAERRRHGCRRASW